VSGKAWANEAVASAVAPEDGKQFLAKIHQKKEDERTREWNSQVALSEAAPELPKCEHTVGEKRCVGFG
jgi:hypothetical protein